MTANTVFIFDFIVAKQDHALVGSHQGISRGWSGRDKAKEKTVWV